jgi:hypothetical protein
MKSFVIDASVIIKWVFPDRVEEDHFPQAINLLRSMNRYKSIMLNLSVDHHRIHSPTHR